MGKHRRQRQKLHIPAKNEPEKSKNEKFDSSTLDTSHSILQPSANLFAGIDINFDGLKKDLDDTRSVKSFKSVKSEAAGNKTMLKKDKIKLRREMLLKKIDTVNQMKLESKRRKKRINVSIIGNTNPLHDALPSLQSLLVNSASTSNKKRDAKPKAIQKASKRKKQLVQDIQMFQKLMANKDFQKNRLQMISRQVQAVVAQAQGNAKAK